MFLRRSLWTVARCSAALNPPIQSSCLVAALPTRIAAASYSTPVVRGEAIWVKSTGELPPGAVLGGYENIDGKKLDCYVGRAVEGKALIPGKMCPWDRCTFIGDNNTEIVKREFEVLVKGHWVKSSGDNIPPNAIPAGTRDGGKEVLYIGRVKYGDTITIGKVHQKDSGIGGGGCWFAYDGTERVCTNFEIFCA